MGKDFTDVFQTDLKQVFDCIRYSEDPEKLYELVNIDICKEKFKGITKIDYYCNNGYNLNELNDSEYSALFTYDAMVHFEMMDIFEYLKDIYRVLRKGGMALFHHSNDTSNYKNSFSTAIGGRSYMSKDLFAYLAYRAGFEIVEQHVFDWSAKDLDCVSLVSKK